MSNTGNQPDKKDRKPVKKEARKKKFAWSYKNEKGAVLRGEIMAVSINSARMTLRQNGVKFQTITPVRDPFFGGKVTSDDIVMFMRQLATMQQAGVSTFEAMTMLRDSTEKPALRDLYSTLLKDMAEEGNQLSQSLSLYPKHFDYLTIELIKAGEKGGVLGTILNQLATYQEESRILRKKTRSALMYPAVTILVMIAVVIILMVKVIPVFAGLFKSFGASLPELTQMVIDLSNWMGSHVILLIFVPIVLIAAEVYSYRRYPKFRWFADRLLLQLPVIGELTLKSSVARFASTLSLMQRAGVPMNEILETLKKISGNSLIDAVVGDAYKTVTAGGNISDALKGTIFPKMAVNMVGIGERTGELDAMSAKVAEFYTQEVKEMVDRMSTLLEPFIMIFLGVVVGTLVVAMYLPMLDMGQVILKGSGAN
jgi:type IV pilus assembly protein PilC